MLGNQSISEYVFRNDYYFFCGDNVSNSKDCRYLGFVPEIFIVGVVQRISYSIDSYTQTCISDRYWKRIE